MNRQYFSYDLFNTDSETVEATQNMTADDARERNRTFRANGEPRMWRCTPWVNH